MRLGVCDIFSTQYPKLLWVCQEAQALGWEVVKIRGPEGLKREGPRCDWVLFSQQPPVMVEDLVRLSNVRECPWVVWVFDYLQRGGELPLLEETPWQVYDAVFSKMPEALPREVYHSYYLDQAMPPWEPIPEDYPRPVDILFPGRCTRDRVELMQTVGQWRARVAVAGQGWEKLEVEPGVLDLGRGVRCQYLGGVYESGAMRSMFGACKVCLGSNFDNNTPGYWSDRPYLAAAAGAVYVGPHVGGGRKWLLDGNLDFPQVARRCREPLWLARQREYQAARCTVDTGMAHKGKPVRERLGYGVRLREIADKLEEVGLVRAHQVAGG